MPKGFSATHGSAVVHAYPRGNGQWSLNWREGGARRSTSRATEEKARAFAERKARELDQATGAQWIPPAQAELLQLLRQTTGPDREPFALLSELKSALRILAGSASLDTAAAYFMEQGPGTVQLTTAAEAITRFLQEYDQGGSNTAKTHKATLSKFRAAHPGLLLMDLSTEHIRADIHRGSPAPQTVANRHSSWRTFLNRCRDWELLPQGRKHPAETIKTPRLPEASPPIFSLEQGAAMLSAAKHKNPKLLPFAILCGWMGLRASEAERVTWSAVDLDAGSLHVSTAVAQKLLQERFVPIPYQVAAALRPLRPADPRRKCCRLRDQRNLSALFRATDGSPDWPTNGLRHSWFSYTLARTENINQLAEWGGNSAAVIRRRYRRPVTQAAGQAWLDLLQALD